MKMTERPVEDSVADVVSDILVIELRGHVNRNFDSAQKVFTIFALIRWFPVSRKSILEIQVSR